MSFIVVYITHPDMECAREIASHLLAERLIACVNFIPITSMYWWEGKVEDASEVVSIVKTRKENWPRLKAEVEKMHPYKVPCIMRLTAEANKKYGDWIAAETKKTKR
jgi:periplasmic divalent cation tolerance protein